jgi:hypothetical protein
MYDGTIWDKWDSAVMRPPLHFRCRSRLNPYMGKIPGARDYKKVLKANGDNFEATDIKRVEKKHKVFKTRYWESVNVQDIMR